MPSTIQTSHKERTSSLNKIPIAEFREFVRKPPKIDYATFSEEKFAKTNFPRKLQTSHSENL
jgi:hypothetical protein